jgi:hypothetical protein
MEHAADDRGRGWRGRVITDAVVIRGWSAALDTLARETTVRVDKLTLKGISGRLLLLQGTHGVLRTSMMSGRHSGLGSDQGGSDVVGRWPLRGGLRGRVRRGSGAGATSDDQVVCTAGHDAVWEPRGEHGRPEGGRIDDGDGARGGPSVTTCSCSKARAVSDARRRAAAARQNMPRQRCRCDPRRPSRVPRWL